MPFVALAEFATGIKQVQTSNDAIAWVARSSPTDSNGGFSIVFGAGVFVALCFAADGHTWISIVSSDGGVTWSSHAVPQPNGVEYKALTYHAGLGLFVAVDSGNGTSAKVITSPDGVTWVQTASILQGADSQLYEAVTSGPGLLVAVGDDSASHKVVATSPDGTTWTVRLGAGVGKDWNAVCFGGGQYVAVTGTSADHQVMTSPDGFTWALQVTPTPRQFWNGVCFGAGLYVAVGTVPSGTVASKVMTSPDGITWTMQTPPAGTLALQNVIFANGLFVAVGSGSAGANVITSPDGIVWTLQTSAIPNALQAVAFGGPVVLPVDLVINFQGALVYHKADAFASESYAQLFIVQALKSPDFRPDQPFKVKPGADFVIRAAQAGELSAAGSLQPAFDLFVKLKDQDGRPYSNDWVDIGVIFGRAGDSPLRFGTAAGLIYPELYLPANQHLLIDVKRL
jgi:hypothetical protein